MKLMTIQTERGTEVDLHFHKREMCFQASLNEKTYVADSISRLVGYLDQAEQFPHGLEWVEMCKLESYEFWYGLDPVVVALNERGNAIAQRYPDGSVVALDPRHASDHYIHAAAKDAAIVKRVREKVHNVRAAISRLPPDKWRQPILDGAQILDAALDSILVNVHHIEQGQ